MSLNEILLVIQNGTGDSAKMQIDQMILAESARRCITNS